MYALTADHLENAKYYCEQIESSDDHLMMEFASIILGLGRNVLSSNVNLIIENCPKIKILMLGVKPVDSLPAFGLLLVKYIDQENDFGRMCDAIRKAHF